MKQQLVSAAGLVTIPDVCLPLDRTERIARGNSSAIVYGAGNLELCRKKILPLLNVSSCKNVSSSSATNCATGDFQRPSVSFINSKFYAFSEFYYTMEDILRMGGKYNSVRFQLAAQVHLFCVYKVARNFSPKINSIQCTYILIYVFITVIGWCFCIMWCWIVLITV